jgi:two-component system cell cycle response regulator CpdR
MANILIVDDDPAMLGFLEQALDKAGHGIMKAENGLEALRLLEENENVDLLLCDVVMPGMDGIELSKRAHQMLPHIRVMFMTGFSAVALGPKNPEKTGNEVMSKPFHLKDLLGRVEEILAS